MRRANGIFNAHSSGEIGTFVISYRELRLTAPGGGVGRADERRVGKILEDAEKMRGNGDGGVGGGC